MYIKEFAELVEKMQNEHIVVTHTTQRTSLQVIKETLKNALSEEKFQKTILFMEKRRKKIGLYNLLTFISYNNHKLVF
jgi:hypothetical protein